MKFKNAFIPFLVLGDPDYNTSLELIKKAIDTGADMLELGFPFSDPIADGPVIQAADNRALKAGMNTDKCLKMIKEIRAFSKIPISLLLYYNLVYQRGIEKFCKDAKEAGVNAILAADVPIEESDPLIKAAKKHGIKMVFLVTPTTTDERLDKIISRTTGYIYIVSILGVTGARTKVAKSTLELINRVRQKTDKSLALGFGISKPEHVQQALKEGVDGVIVGSAITNIIEKNLGNKAKMMQEISDYMAQMKSATRRKV